MRKIPKKRFLDVAGMILRNKMAKEAIYPFYCSFKLTRRCNFTCSFCNCWHVKNKWIDMPTEDVKAVLDNLARSSVIVCSFEGGDPLVRDDILELLKYQYEKPDRKSTRLNSSHLVISYAVFCLKKKRDMSQRSRARSHIAHFPQVEDRAAHPRAVRLCPIERDAEVPTHLTSAGARARCRRHL